MFCLNCGYPLNEGDKECSFCGKEVAGTEELQESQPQAAKANEEAHNVENELDFSDNEMLDQSNYSMEGYEKNYLSLDEDDDDGLPSNSFGNLEGFDNNESLKENDENDNLRMTSIDDLDNFPMQPQYDTSHVETSSNNKFSDFLDDNEIPEAQEKPAIEIVHQNIQSDELYMKDEDVSVDPSAFLSRVVKGNDATIDTSREPLKGGRLEEFAKSFDMKKNRVTIIIFIVFAALCSLVLIFRGLSMFVSNNSAGLILAETKNVQEMLKSFVDENVGVMSNEITVNNDKNISSKFEFSNIDIDAMSFSRLGLPNPEQITQIKNDMRIIWDRKNSPKENFIYNDFDIMVKDKEFFRIMNLKQEKYMFVMIPTIYQKKFAIDTTNMQGFYKAVGINKDPGFFDRIVSDGEYTTALTINPSIVNVAAEYNNVLTKVMLDKNLSMDTDVKFAIKDTQYTSTKYTIKFDDSIVKPLFKILVAKMNDPEMYKAVAGRYMVIGDVIKQLGLDDGRLKDFGKDKYTSYINSLIPYIDTLTFESAGGNIWVDQTGNLLGRNYEFNVKSGEMKAKIGISYTDKRDTGSETRVARLVCEPKTAGFRNIEIKTEKDIKFDQFQNTKTIKSAVDTTTVIFGNPAQKGYFGFEIRSDKNYKSDAENKRTYLVRFDSREDDIFSLKINATGTERGAVKSNKYNGEYAVEYEIISSNAYKGKFNVKYDTVYGEPLDANPASSPLLDQSYPLVELNSISDKMRGEEFLSIQLAYMKWLQNMDVLLEQKPTSK